MISPLVELEILRHPWDAMKCGCGRDASHLAASLVAFFSGERDESTPEDWFESHVMYSEVLCEPSVAVVQVMLAGLASGAAVSMRDDCFGCLWSIAGGESQRRDVPAGRDLVEECKVAARFGLWLFYGELFSGRSVQAAAHAFETLLSLEADRDRLERVREVAAPNLPWYLRQAEDS